MQNENLTEALEFEDIEEIERILKVDNPSRGELTEALQQFATDFMQPMNLQIIELLLQSGADPNAPISRDPDDDDPDEPERNLLYEFLWNMLEGTEKSDSKELYKLCQILFQYGANPNSINSDGNGYAFGLVCNYLREDLVELFLQNGALAETEKTQTPPKETPLYELFTRKNDKEAMARITRLLLDAGAKPDTPCEGWKRTPLMMAVSAGAEKACELLLQAGANANHIDRDGLSIIDLAMQHGKVHILNILSEHGAQVSPYQLYRTQLRNAFKKEDFSSAAKIGDSILKLNNLSPKNMDETDCLMISQSYTGTGRHDEAIELAQNWQGLKKSEPMISRLINAMVYGSRFEKAIETYIRYRSSITIKGFDPFMIANLLAVYDMLGRHKEGIAELANFFTEEGAGNDKGLMKFNAACLYSICGDMENSLKMTALALEAGKDKESFYNDKGLENLRKAPGFELLMSDEPVMVEAFEHKGTGRYMEFILHKYRREVIIRENFLKGSSKPCKESTLEFDSVYEPILVYLNKLEQFNKDEYELTQPLCIDYWIEQITGDLALIDQSQKAGNLPAFGVYLVEWDFGDEDCLRNMWMGYYSHTDVPDADEFTGSYIYGDDVLGDASYEGPPIDTARQFETIVNELIQTREYQAVQKESPFYFVYQEHDSGQLCTVKV